MSPENADNMKPSRHINSEKFNIINKREIDKNNKKKQQIAVADLKVM